MPTDQEQIRQLTDVQLLTAFDRLTTHATHQHHPLRFALDVLPHHFPLAFAHLHREIMRLTFPTRVEESGPSSDVYTSLSHSSIGDPTSQNPTAGQSGYSVDKTLNQRKEARDGHESCAGEVSDGIGVRGTTGSLHQAVGESPGQRGAGEQSDSDSQPDPALDQGAPTDRGGLDRQFTSIAAPRGFAKSTRMTS